MADSIDFSDVNKALSEIVARAQDLGPIVDEIKEIVLSSIAENFQQGGRYGNDNPFGGGSRKWKTSKRAGTTPAGKTLLDTSRLASSITGRQEGQELVFGTNVVYGAIHQFGGETGRAHKVYLTARPYLVLQNEDIIDITDAVLSYYASLFS